MGRYIILKAEIKDTTYVLINVYAPNKDKDLIEFLTNLLITLKEENLDSEENIIMGGDFNCPLNPAIDKKRRHTY
jgi:exonuclease III